MEDLDRLRTDCELAAKFWGRTFSALGAVTYREKGVAALGDLWVLLLRQHQSEFYEQGLRKLGIDDGEPPAIKAAKYHYFTNMIGGLTMDYIEESPKKVWIRYTAPMWTYPGTTMLAIPGSLRRRIFTAWHPRNGKLMRCPRLGWVSTKFIMEGEPYDEGYFQEYDRELLPGEEYRFEVVHRTPEFNSAKAPQLDAKIWPEARMLKARRNWSREYVRTTIDCLFQLFGEQITYFIFRQAMRGLAIQYTQELKQDTQVAGADSDAIAKFIVTLLRACNQQFELDRGGAKTRIKLYSFLPFPGHASEELRSAMFEFPVMAARLLNGRVSVIRQAKPEYETWEIDDAGKWLW
ncbi:hypothetical protein [Bradyrhizobium arachidis]|uniref:hypothetical protein n=1 Tax=Bradyrhizobium arachidis TaxID=858423 RepID=UPI002161CA07|nr:hypothetical protein [Bradyrhizobium arachidis]UVO30467.1 hypothetical protein KUF59_07210 [Bradyrhizobium arachidis]